jgi:spore photoproduct lyase
MFSHIYYEEEIRNHPQSIEIFNKFPNAIQISTSNYKNVFNPYNQNFQAQKNKKKLILAKKRDHFIYNGSPVTDTFKRGKFYYNSLMMNCLYNCEYCYLQGMYNSSHIVVFVNIEDFFKETIELLNIEKKITICISYDTDLLAMERFIPYTSQWIEFASTRPGLTLEIRTKSNSYKNIAHLRPTENVILAWTLSPEEIVKNIEFGTPTLNRRIESLKEAIKDGWKTRICLDPILHIKNWRLLYKCLIHQIFEDPEILKVEEITFGVFRINSEYLKKMKKMRSDSKLLYYPYKKNGKIDTYSSDIENKIKEFIFKEINHFLPIEKIFY